MYLTELKQGMSVCMLIVGLQSVLQLDVSVRNTRLYYTEGRGNTQLS